MPDTKKCGTAAERERIMKTKALAFVLAFCMVIGTFAFVPTRSYAKTADSADKVVAFLTNLGIMETDEYTGEFWNDSLVKRFEMAQILCRLFGYDAVKDSTKKFNDVGEVDRPYVETAVRNGLMAGYGDGKFGPNDYVTCGQVIKIFVDLAGGSTYANVCGGFPQGYITAAKKFGIISSLNVAADAEASRIYIAQVIYDALHTELIALEGISTDGYANYTIRDGETLLSELFGIEIINGVIEAIDSTSLNRPNGGTGEDVAIIAEQRVLDPEHLSDEYFGSNVKAYVKKSKAADSYTLIYIEEKSSNKRVEIWGDSITAVTEDFVKYTVGDRVKEQKFSPVTDMIYNGKAINFDETKLKNQSNVNIKMTDSDGDGVINAVFVTEYKDLIVDRVNAEKEKIYFKYGEAALSLEGCFVRMFLDGEKEDFTVLGKETVVSVAASEGTGEDRWITILGCTDTAYGTVDSMSTQNGVRYANINGEKYEITAAAEGWITAGHIPSIKVGAGGQFYLNTRGEIVYFKSGGNTDSVGYLVAIGSEGDAFSREVRFQIYTDQGKLEIFNAKDKININGSSIKVDNLLSRSEWTELSNDVAGKQLIKYVADDGIIKKITYCSNTPSYDPNEWSLDVKESLYVRKQYVLGYTYSVDSSTKVFYVPTTYSSNLKDYKMLTGTYFKRDKTYDVSLYDLSSLGRVSYALVRASGSVLTVDNDFVFVTELSETTNSDGNIVNVITGYNVAGNLIDLVTDDDSPLTDSSDPPITIEKGDFIQYAKNGLGTVEELKVVHKLSDTTHNGIGTVHTGDRLVSFGYAANIGDAGFLVSETNSSGEISPLDAKAVIATGGTVLLHTSERGTVEKVSFADILPGDEIYALTNASNTTMMVIIYR